MLRVSPVSNTMLKLHDTWIKFIIITLRVTRGALNPNLQVAITLAWRVMYVTSFVGTSLKN